MDPMPSGAAAHQNGKGANAAAVGAGGRAKRADMGGVAAVGEPGVAAALATLGRARAGAQAAMHPAAAVAHGRLTAGAAGAGAGAAAGRGEEVAGPGAIPQPPAAVRRQACGGQERRKRPMEFMLRGGCSDERRDHQCVLSGCRFANCSVHVLYQIETGMSMKPKGNVRPTHFFDIERIDPTP